MLLTCCRYTRVIGQVCIADCNILKDSLLWQCVRSFVLFVQVATRLGVQIMIMESQKSILLMKDLTARSIYNITCKLKVLVTISWRGSRAEVSDKSLSNNSKWKRESIWGIPNYLDIFSSLNNVFHTAAQILLLTGVKFISSRKGFKSVIAN